jgi:hypothetical protein
MDEHEQFWCVWCLEHSQPTVKHHSLDSAHREATRLALQYPGNRFYVVEALGYHERAKPTVYTQLAKAELPF